MLLLQDAGKYTLGLLSYQKIHPLLRQHLDAGNLEENDVAPLHP